MELSTRYTDFVEDIEAIFRDDLLSYSKSVDLYRSLCNTAWQKNGENFMWSWRAAGELVADLRNGLDLPKMDADTCQNCGKAKAEHKKEEETFEPFWSDESLTLTHLYCTNEHAKQFVPGYSGREDYMDFYCSGHEGEVPDWVERKMLAGGYTINSDS